MPQRLPTRRRGGVLPRPRTVHQQIRTTNGDHATCPVPHWCIPICGIVPPGGVEPLPYANLEVLAIQRKQCDFADASWRVDVGIDPYKRATDSPGCIRVCGCILPGGQGRPPLRVRAYSHRCVQICGIVLPGGASPAPTLRRKTPLHTKTRERRLPLPVFPLYCPPICFSSIPRTCAGGIPSTKPNSP